MRPETFHSFPSTAPSTDEPLALRVWEAISTERELRGVLAAAADAVVPIVPFDGVGIVAMGMPAVPFLLHFVLHDSPSGENCSPTRSGNPDPPNALPSRPQAPYDDLTRLHSSGEPYVCPDLLAKPAWYPHEFKLAAVGIRAYVAVPLLVRGERIGVASFVRRSAAAFTAQQVAALQEVSRPLAVAVSNAVAYEEIRRLRDQLAAENIALKEQLGQMPWAEEIVGNSEALRRVLEAVEQVAATDATVLITGETGTGKELIARAIHRRSRRAQGPLIKVNCAAIPETLLASELFGHERGAFTGAHERRKGRFEQAHGGTLFLDEIGDLSAEMQVLLLRVLQERELERLGGTATVEVDVRLIAATNHHLPEAVRAGRFREDLFYRLNVFPISMPALRDRRSDIPLLVSRFAAEQGKRHGRPVERIDRRTMRMFESYPWPGNVRELENLVERAVITSRGGTLRLDRGALPATIGPMNLAEHVQGQERETIEAALRNTGGRISGPRGAAVLLGIPSTTLESKIQRLGIDKFRFKRGRVDRSVIPITQANLPSQKS
ncbi:MAG TPA: sigma 54-interacting transcriptional regulator [Terriglobia bacterium]|nr:sigma 54-interacting transcriptional regulator [Terriglobia bacterium]